MKSTIITGVAITILLSLPVARTGGQDGSGNVRVVTRPNGVTTLDDRYEGLVGPSKQQIISAPLDGLISKIHVEENDVVKANQVLVTLDDAVQQLVVEAARLRAESDANIKVAEVALQDAQNELKEQDRLLTGGTTTLYARTKAYLAVKAREAEVRAAKDEQKIAESNLRLETERLERYQLKAPFDGTVIEVAAEEGGNLARNDRILSLAAMNTLEARLNLPNDPFFYVMKQRVGEEFRLDAGAPVNKVITAKLKSVRHVIDPGSGTFLCTFEIENSDDPKERMPSGFEVNLVWPQ